MSSFSRDSNLRVLSSAAAAFIEISLSSKEYGLKSDDTEQEIPTTSDLFWVPHDTSGYRDLAPSVLLDPQDCGLRALARVVRFEVCEALLGDLVLDLQLVQVPLRL